MIRWFRVLALASLLAIGQSCGLRPVELPRIDPHGALPAAQSDAGQVGAGMASGTVRMGISRPGRIATAYDPARGTTGVS